MIFIFGFHPVTKTVGPIEEKLCSHCNNKKHWLLTKSTYYISLFFIPLIPTKRQYLEQCPICQNNNELAESEFKSKEGLAILNTEALASNMSETEYKKRLSSL